MKIRNGFVSNSSSSSFILACNKDKINEELEITVKIKLSSLVEEEITNEEELKEYLKDNYWIEGEIEQSPKYKQYLKILNSGKKLFVCIVSNEEDPTKTFLYDKGINQSDLPEDVIIIDEVQK